jgi:hypothetical protein
MKSTGRPPVGEFVNWGDLYLVLQGASGVVVSIYRWVDILLLVFSLCLIAYDIGLIHGRRRKSTST